MFLVPVEVAEDRERRYEGIIVASCGVVWYGVV